MFCLSVDRYSSRLSSSDTRPSRWKVISFTKLIFNALLVVVSVTALSWFGFSFWFLDSVDIEHCKILFSSPLRDGSKDREKHKRSIVKKNNVSVVCVGGCPYLCQIRRNTQFEHLRFIW